MIYVCFRDNVEIEFGETLTLGALARVHPSERALCELPVECPAEPGLWPIDPLDIVASIEKTSPGAQVALLDEEFAYVHRRARASRMGGLLRALRGAVLFVLLFFGSAFAITYFHADVDMPGAQRAFYAAIVGHEPDNALWIALPYALGVALGVAGFFALIGPRGATPLHIKLLEYRKKIGRLTCRMPRGDGHG